MLEFDNKKIEQLLIELESAGFLFPQFALKQQESDGMLKLLGRGGYSSVYEMYLKDQPQKAYALKVIGFQRHGVSSREFQSTGRIQWILSQESKYVLRILDTRELFLNLNESGKLLNVQDTTKEAWEEEEIGIHMQFVLMEKLDELIEKDRFGNAKLLRTNLCNQTEVLQFALEIGQALQVAHRNQCLHRDIKLENIFWDKNEQVYKLGDFGIAKYTENGNAETIVYTDGYGAPEIEMRLMDSYNATADIYSFGITLYLLLNDLKFPGSDGYYPIMEVQYHPDFVFPAPLHASEKMTRILRKMCSYQQSERYQSLQEVLQDLLCIVDSDEVDTTEELYALADMVTETFREGKIQESKEPEEITRKPKTREERIHEQRITELLYRRDSIRYLLVLTVLMTLLFKAMHTDVDMISHWFFWLLPAMVLLEAVFQGIQELQYIWGIVTIAATGYSLYSYGAALPQIVIILCILSGCPVLSLAAALSTGFWILLEKVPQLGFLDILWKWDLDWIFFIAVCLVSYRFFRMKDLWEKINFQKKYFIEAIYPIGFLLMAVLGFILWVLGKCGVIMIPQFVQHLHLVRSGAISLLAVLLVNWWVLVKFEKEIQEYQEEINGAETQVIRSVNDL